MPFVFIIIGIVFLVSGVRGQAATLVTLVENDLTGTNNFSYWILSILVIGALGYVSDLRIVSRLFLALVILILIDHSSTQGGGGGVFSEFQSAFDSITGKKA